MIDRRRHGPWALIAGGTEGIGLAFARAAADAGLDLLLVSHDPASLATATDELARRTTVVPLELDLTSPTAIDDLDASVGGREVGLVVANAALSPIGDLLDVDESVLRDALRLNAEVPLLLAHRFGRPMRARGRGGVILMSSLSGLQGTEVLATYAATKAFTRVLAEGAWAELRRAGVDVLAVVPGTVDTPGLRSSQPRGGPTPMAPSQVASEALAALGRQPVVVPGRGNRLTALLTARLLPRRAAIRLIGTTTRRMYRDRL